LYEVVLIEYKNAIPTIPYITKTTLYVKSLTRDIRPYVHENLSSSLLTY